MKNDDLRGRTKQFALRVVKLYVALPKSVEAQVLGKQLLRSGTSVGAHYREAHRAKSNADFASNIDGALQELDETTYWLELLEESGIFSSERLGLLRAEAEELTRILVTIAKHVKQRMKEVLTSRRVNRMAALSSFILPPSSLDSERCKSG